MALDSGRLSLRGKSALHRRRTRAAAAAILVASSLTMIAPAWAASGWHTTPTPNPGVHYAYQARGLTGVVALSATNAWAVGAYSSLPGGVRPMLLHWTGKSWTTVTPPTPQGGSGSLRFISAHGAADIWALGTQASSTARWYLLHYNGHAWHAVNTAGVSAKFSAFGIAADTPTSVWIGGLNTTTNKPAAEHWDGAHWTSSSAPLPAAAEGAQFSAISVIPGTHRPLAVGHYLTRGATGFYPYAAEWSGGAWHQMAMSTATFGDLRAVVMLSATNAWAAGIRYPGDRTSQTFTQHWNGQAWTIVPTPSRAGGSSSLLAITGNGPKDVWAVGYSTACKGSCYRSLAEHFNGQTWSISTTPNPAVGKTTFNAFWNVAVVPGTTQVWAVGTRGPARPINLAEFNSEFTFAARAN